MGCARIFKFNNNVSKKLIQSQMKVAMAMAKCIFGSAKVKFNAGYVVSKNQAIIDVSSDVGKYLAEEFKVLMSMQVGKDEFSVQRIKTKD